jgi:aryl-alcohol dehydrogenase-like predicted oxidoreductase
VTFGSGVKEEQAEEVIQLAYDSGINVFDLSEAYSGVRAEVELGRILQRRGWKRSSYIVTTKIYWNTKCVQIATFKRKVVASRHFENRCEDTHNMSKFREVVTISLRVCNNEKINTI